jgi:diguanylate cyclase (GGDEF)-like protein/PAS domain S-box-containing protein
LPDIAHGKDAEDGAIRVKPLLGASLFMKQKQLPATPKPTGSQGSHLAPDAATMAEHSEPDGIQYPDLLSKQQLLERQLNDVQGIGHVGTWEFQVTSNKLIWSDETYRILALDKSRSEASLETYLSSVHPGDRHSVLTLIEQLRHGPVHPKLEHRVIWPNGEVRHLLVRGYPFRGEDGSAAVSGTVHDITELKQSSEALKAMSRKLFNALESMTDAFYTVDKDWRFTYLNKEAERHLQRPRDELLGKVIWDEFPDLRGTGFESEFRQAMGQNRPSAFEEVYLPYNAWKELRIFPSPDGLAVYFTDITEQKRLQEIERQNAERFKVVAKATTDIIWDWDVTADRIWWNEGLQSVFGYPPDEFDDGLRSWARRLHPDERDHVLDGLYAAMEPGSESWHDEYRFLRNDGTYADVRDHGIFIRDSRGKVMHVIGSMVDITQQKQADVNRLRAEARNLLQASLLDKAHDAISVTGEGYRITYWNRGAERLFGWTADEVIGKTKAELFAIGREEVPIGYRAVLEHGDWSGEITKPRKDGGSVTVESHLTLVRGDDGRPQSVLEIETDITQRKQAEQEIASLAFFDPLTHLPNRRLLLDRLRHALATCRRVGRTGALLFLDLDNFKTLNDTLGHDKGDLLLQQVAQRLSARVPRASDTVARHGGDEFVIVLEDLSANQQEAAAQAETVAEKILAAFNAPFKLNDHDYHTSPSIGVAMFDEHISNVDELLKRADLAMYQAKGAGRNTIRFFDLRMQTVINARVALETALRHGLQLQEFILHYQRQTDRDGRTIGAEALVRWQHPRGKVVSPALFIPLAEETGLILPLGQWVLEAACKQLVAWAARRETAHLTLAVNVSARQFRQPAFVEQVLEIIERTGADPAMLKLELTESLLVANVEHTVDIMKALKAQGIGFALDDFGTGYSSLSYLKRLPLDQLKIDKSFVRDVLTDPNDAAIARTILGLGHTLGLDVIAEGVETPAQRDFLAQHGCRAYQGYLFGRPVSAEQF